MNNSTMIAPKFQNSTPRILGYFY